MGILDFCGCRGVIGWILPFWGATRLERRKREAAASLLEIWLWAGMYQLLGALSDLEGALYFSAVTFTTLGYGDVVLQSSWRLLASFQAVNGIIMFGWTTAVIVALVQRILVQESSPAAGTKD